MSGTRIVQAPAPGAVLSTGSVLTIGAFDGVHLGHRAVLQLVRELADARGLEAAVVTFDRHPAEVVRPESAPPRLTTLEEKLELLEATGLPDLVVVLTFDEERRREPAEDFVQEVLVGMLRARIVVVGADFHFGHRRGGTVELLARMGTDLGFEVLGLNLVAPGSDPSHEPYSSTRIRALLAAGDVEGAAALLGRLHEVRGTVVRGDERGRRIGFPTANIAVPAGTCLPADGIYAGWLRAGHEPRRAAAISLGRRPTFYEHADRSLLEAHVLDFDGDLYDCAAAVRFAARLRDERRFDTVDALVEQMSRDIAATRDRLGGGAG